MYNNIDLAPRSSLIALIRRDYADPILFIFNLLKECVYNHFLYVRKHLQFLFYKSPHVLNEIIRVINPRVLLFIFF